MYTQRTNDGVRITLEGVEPRMLADLLDLLTDLVTQAVPPQQDDDDPFAFWEAQHAADERLHRDAALARLFPRASSDPEADHHLGEFSRVIVAQQRLDELEVVRADLAGRGRRGRVVVPLEHVDAWLRTLNAVNLLLTARLGMTDAEGADEVAMAVALDDDDPRAFGYHVHMWVAGTIESILDVL